MDLAWIDIFIWGRIRNLYCNLYNSNDFAVDGDFYSQCQNIHDINVKIDRIGKSVDGFSVCVQPEEKRASFIKQHMLYWSNCSKGIWITV